MAPGLAQANFWICLLLKFLVIGPAPVAAVIRGVNIGGWLVTERWITPSVYSGSNNSKDEWHLCNYLGKASCQSVLNYHWSSFYTRDDFAAIKSVGLNAVRIPIGYWAVDVRDDEPYVSGQFPYLIRAVNWAQELGLIVSIDLHGAPGSQNGQDNSGLIGPVLFPTNSSNSDRSLNVLKNLTAEFSQSIYGGVVQSIELLNEPRLGSGWDMTALKGFYSAGIASVRAASLRTMNVTFHDAFWGPSYWSGWTPSSGGSNNLVLDTHQYYAFPPLNNLPQDQIIASICNVSGILKQNQASSAIPYTLVGEWSLETGSAPNASSSNQNSGDDQAKRTWFRKLFEAQLAAYSPNGAGQVSLGWYYWCWKTQYDIDTWSYRRGVSMGYIPSDVSNSSTYAFPVLPNGCIQSTFPYTAPSSPLYGPPLYSSASAHLPPPGPSIACIAALITVISCIA